MYKSYGPPRDLPSVDGPIPQTAPWGTTKRHSRVRRETAVIGGLYTIVLLIELEHFVGVPSIRLDKEGECFKDQQGKQ